jgi:hypothetical protein
MARLTRFHIDENAQPRWPDGQLTLDRQAAHPAVGAGPCMKLMMSPTVIWSGETGQEIAAREAPLGVDQAAVLELAQDDLQEPGRDGLGIGDVGNLGGAPPLVFGQFEYRPQGVLVFPGRDLRHTLLFVHPGHGLFVD